MNKRGFTLIELLAVIVILAIIALIATPIILNMINSAKKSSARSSALGYIEAIEYNNGFAEVEQPGYTSVIGENLNVTDISIKVKGKKPSSGTVTINSKGKVESASGLCFNGYSVDYDGKDAKVKGKCSGGSSSTSNFGGTKVAPTSTDTHKGIVYMDPSDLSVKCNANSTLTTTPTGCKKFYIYDDSGNTYKMIMDRNTTGITIYDSSGSYKEYENSEIKTQVDEDTAGWVGNPRIITVEELAAVTNNSSYNGHWNTWFYFDGEAKSGKGTSNYAWLYDNTAGCEYYGCDTEGPNGTGYWTSSPILDDTWNVWYVKREGHVYFAGVNGETNCGIRPVITIDKSLIN